MPMNLANPVWQREPFHRPRIEESELVANEVDCWCVLVFQIGFAKQYINWPAMILCSSRCSKSKHFSLPALVEELRMSQTSFKKHIASRSHQCRSLQKWKETVTSRRAAVLYQTWKRHVNSGKFLEFCLEFREFRNSFSATWLPPLKQSNDIPSSNLT